MAREIYRKESVERMKSPDRLDTYIRVTSPGLWLLFGAVIVLLLSALAWGIFGRIIVSVDGIAVVDAGEAQVYVPESKIASVKPGMTIRVGEAEGTVDSITDVKGTLPQISASYGGNYKSDDSVTVYHKVIAYIFNLPDGAYDASIVTETVQPFSFITN